MPRKVFVAGEILTAADVNTNLMDQAVMSFAGTAARGSAIPSPVEGMVAYLNDDNLLYKYNGASWESVTSSAAMPTGSILQVVSTTKTDTFTTSSTSFVDVTGVSATITPRSTSSKIFVLVSGFGNMSVGDRPGYIRLVRDSTGISIGDQYLTNTSWVRTSSVINSSGSSPDINGEAFGFSFLDAPSTSASVTYKIQARVGTATPGTFAIGRPNSTVADDANRWTTPTSITLIEVAG